jgi:hypothetical protein
MTPESFPRRGQDGEEPEGYRPLPAGRNEPGGTGRLPEDGRRAPDDDGTSGLEQGLFVCLPAEELTLEGFAQNGRSDTMAPGALLATVLDAVVGEGGSGLAALGDDQLIGVISAVRRMESRTAWTLMAALAELARRRPASGDPGDRGQYGFSEFAPDEVAAELRLSVQSAAGQMMYAVAVAGRLPRSFAALAAGQIHPVHLRIIDDETRILSAELAATADEILAGAAQSKTYGELRYAARRLVLKLDPDAARRRKEDAAKHEAQVRKFREESGNAGMIARELPCDEVLASWQHVDQRAHDLRAAGMPGSLRELRIRAYLDLLQERDSRLAPGVPDPGQAGRPAGPDGGDPPGGTGGPGGPVGPHDSDGGPGSGPDGGPGGTSGPGTGPQGGPASPARQARQDHGPAVAALINLTVPLDTVLGRSATPGEAAGFGLLDPSDVRALVEAAARHPDTRWCVTALHPDGTAAAHGCARGRHPPPPAPGPAGGVGPHGDPPDPDPPPGNFRLTDPGSPPGPDPPPGHPGPSDPGGSPGTDPPPSTAAVGAPRGADPTPGAGARQYLAGLRIRMTPVARGHCDHIRAESAYRPSRALAHLIKVRNTRCTAPGCAQPAARCDLDHTLAWDQGGITCQCGLAPLCRHHHRCKQAEGWRLAQPEPGVLRWLAPAGRTYTTAPTEYPV